MANVAASGPDGAAELHVPRWHFLDATGRDLGPFSAFEMRKWHARGHLPEGRALLVRLQEWRWHVPLSAVFKEPGAEFVGGTPSWPDLAKGSATAQSSGCGGPAEVAGTEEASRPSGAASEAQPAGQGDVERDVRHWGTVVAVLPDRSCGMINCDELALQALGYGCLVIPGHLLGDIQAGEELAFRFHMDKDSGMPQAVDLMRLTGV